MSYFPMSTCHVHVFGFCFALTICKSLLFALWNSKPQQSNKIEADSPCFPLPPPTQDWIITLIPIRMHLFIPAAHSLTQCTDFPLLKQTRLRSAGYYELPAHPPPLYEQVTSSETCLSIIRFPLRDVCCSSTIPPTLPVTLSSTTAQLNWV